MSTFYKFIQGKEQRIRVYSSNSIIILKNSETVLTFNKVIEENDGMWLKVLVDRDNFIGAGICQYQLFENNELKEYGNCMIVPSLLVDPNQPIQSRAQMIVEAIQKQLAGTASRAQRTVKVGDKEIQYMSTSQLMALLDYFKGKVKEEQGIEEAGINEATDQMKIKYVFRIR